MKRLYTALEKDEIVNEMERIKEEIQEIKSKPCRTAQEQDRLDLLKQELRSLRSM